MRNYENRMHISGRRYAFFFITLCAIDKLIKILHETIFNSYIYLFILQHHTHRSQVAIHKHR